MATEAELENAIVRIDKRLDWIEAALGRIVELQYVPMGRSNVRPDAAGVPAEVIELLRAGKKIHAIKRYRELTGADFTQAREAIEKL
jgi:ribosomal protein L7/L12